MLRNVIPLFPIVVFCTFRAVPVVVVFFAFQRYFLRGLTIGALKG